MPSEFARPSESLLLFFIALISFLDLIKLKIKKATVPNYTIHQEKEVSNKYNLSNGMHWSQTKTTIKDSPLAWLLLLKHNLFRTASKTAKTVILNLLGSYTSPRKTPSRNYISPKNTWPKLHYPEYTFPWTSIFQKLHFPEHALARNYIFLNIH